MEYGKTWKFAFEIYWPLRGAKTFRKPTTNIGTETSSHFLIELWSKMPRVRLRLHNRIEILWSRNWIFVSLWSHEMTFSLCLFIFKVPTLWEGHKIWKHRPPVLTKQLFLLSSIKTSGRFFQIFVTFSEKLDFIQDICYLAKEPLQHC